MTTPNALIFAGAAIVAAALVGGLNDAASDQAFGEWILIVVGVVAAFISFTNSDAGSRIKSHINPDPGAPGSHRPPPA